MKLTLVLTLLLATSAVLASIEDRQVIYERKAIPQPWKVVGFGLPSDPVKFTFALKQRNLDRLNSIFWAVSTPGNPEYRNFLTRDQILDIVAPSETDKMVVMSWLRAQGVTNIVDRRDALVVRTTVAVAEKIFSTKFYRFQHEGKVSTLVRQLGSYSLPKFLMRFVDLVTGVSDFPTYNKIRRSPLADGYVVPATLNLIYNVPAGTSANGSSQGVIEFGAGEDFDATGLQTFAKETGVTIAPLDSKHIINPLPPSGVEGVLDIQYIAGVGAGAENWYWTESDWLYDWATSFFAASEVPSVVSLSYGWAEYDQCEISDECTKLGTNSQGFVLRVNTEFQKIGTRGVSILVASGDSGANGRTDPDCTDKVLHPDYPAASPYVTSVGATQLNSEEFKLPNPPPICKTYQCASSGTETAVSFQISSFTSGGGFSNYAAQPSYQSDAVKAYLSSGVTLPPSSYYNASGRGYPDVSALGHNFLVYDSNEGGWFGVGGTSASSPSFAGYVSFLNAASLKKSGKTLGFLNPLLYQIYAADATSFRDITVGDNICTESGCSSSCKGFRAAKGWDPVTGLGVPNVAKLISYVENNL